MRASGFCRGARGAVCRRLAKCKSTREDSEGAASCRDHIVPSGVPGAAAAVIYCLHPGWRYRCLPTAAWASLGSARGYHMVSGPNLAGCRQLPSPVCGTAVRRSAADQHRTAPAPRGDGCPNAEPLRSATAGQGSSAGTWQQLCWDVAAALCPLLDLRRGQGQGKPQDICQC